MKILLAIPLVVVAFIMFSGPDWYWAMSVIWCGVALACLWDWRVLAWLVTRPGMLGWLKAFSFPYSNIVSRDGSLYMVRLWIFNPYSKGPDGETLPPRWPRLPSIRLHRIMRPDRDRHLHTHPWVARTIVLEGWYIEERMVEHPDDVPPGGALISREHYDETRYSIARFVGYTGPFPADTVHRITEVSTGGVWTLFFTWRKLDSWYFLVDGCKVPWREYLGERNG